MRGVSRRAPANAELDLAHIEVLVELLPLGIGHVAEVVLWALLASPGEVQLVVADNDLVQHRNSARAVWRSACPKSAAGQDPRREQAPRREQT